MTKTHLHPPCPQHILNTSHRTYEIPSWEHPMSPYLICAQERFQILGLLISALILYSTVVSCLVPETWETTSCRLME